MYTTPMAPADLTTPINVAGQATLVPGDRRSSYETVCPAPSTGLTIRWIRTSELCRDERQLRVATNAWWHIVSADPGAYFDLASAPSPGGQPMVRCARLAPASTSLARFTPASGDSLYFPAGTEAALGPGLTILEIAAPDAAVSHHTDHERPITGLPPDDAPFVVSCVELGAGNHVCVVPDEACLAVLSGSGVLGCHDFAASQCWIVHGPVALHAHEHTRLVLVEPRAPAPKPRERLQ